MSKIETTIKQEQYLEDLSVVALGVSQYAGVMRQSVMFPCGECNVSLTDWCPLTGQFRRHLRQA